MKSTPALPTALIPTAKELQDFSLESFPDLSAFLAEGGANRSENWSLAKSFLQFIIRSKSEHTFVSYRNDTEKLLLWLCELDDKSVITMDYEDVLTFIDFCVAPPASWIATRLHDRFLPSSGYLRSNPEWRPFRVKSAKGQLSDNLNIDHYRPSVTTINKLFSALSAFFDYLVSKNACQGNPVPAAKKNCRHLIKSTVEKPVRRLTQAQWEYVLDTAECMANQDPMHERSLFVISTLKTCFLRVSELSERDHALPMMSDFVYSEEYDSWDLIVMGKGRKKRAVTAPNDYIDRYLTRYRKWRGLPPLPLPGETAVLLEKIKGKGGLSSRQIIRIVQDVFDKAYIRMKSDRGEKEARKLSEASSHYLRHTGASMEVERGRPLSQLAAELGHSSSQTTEKHYIKIEDRLRIEGGKTRKVR